MKNKRFISMVMAATITATMFVGCGNIGENVNSAKASDSEVIKIGGLAPLTGNLAVYGVSTSNGYKMAVEEINKNGGVMGKQIELILEDEEGDATKAVNAYNKLMGDGIIGIVGDVTTKPTSSVARKAVKDRIPMITPTSTAAEVTTYGDSVFRACFLDPYQGGSMAKYVAEKMNIKSAAVIYDSADDYSIGIAEAFKAKAEESGITVTAYEAFVGGDTDFKAQLSKIKQTNPEAIFIPTYYNTIALIATQADQLGIDATFMGSDGWDGVLGAIEESNRGIVEGAVFTNHYSSNDSSEKVAEFIENYKEMFGEEPSAFSALGYDATMILIKAIEEAGTTEEEAIISAISSINYEGVTGSFSFEGSGDPIKELSIITIKDSKYELVDKYSM